jgi:hypothetical protein
MEPTKARGKVGRPSRTLDEEIAAAESRVAQLKAKRREDDRRKLEQNQKAIVALVKGAGLDAIDAEVWESALPKLKALLESGSPSKAAKPSEAVGGSPVHLGGDPKTESKP